MQRARDFHEKTFKDALLVAGSYTAGANKSNRKLSSDKTDVGVAEHIFMLVVALIFTINNLGLCELCMMCAIVYTTSSAKLYCIFLCGFSNENYDGFMIYVYKHKLNKFEI